MFHEVVEHVLHAAAATEIAERLRQAQLAVGARADQEHDEIPVDLRRHPAPSYLRHRAPPRRSWTVRFFEAVSR